MITCGGLQANRLSESISGGRLSSGLREPEDSLSQQRPLGAAWPVTCHACVTGWTDVKFTPEIVFQKH